MISFRSIGLVPKIAIVTFSLAIIFSVAWKVASRNDLPTLISTVSDAVMAAAAIFAANSWRRQLEYQGKSGFAEAILTEAEDILEGIHFALAIDSYEGELGEAVSKIEGPVGRHIKLISARLSAGSETATSFQKKIRKTRRLFGQAAENEMLNLIIVRISIRQAYSKVWVATSRIHQNHHIMTKEEEEKAWEEIKELEDQLFDFSNDFKDSAQKSYDELCRILNNGI